MPVTIRGEGVAASCCAHLLAAAGAGVAMERTWRPKIPAILLNQATQKLMAEVFARGDLFRALPRIERRVVAWGPDAAPVSLPHSAVVISEEELAERLRPDSLAPGAAGDAAVDWTVWAARPLPATAVEQHFGTRRAAAFAVKRNTGTDAHACCIESLADGWLFLIPGAGENAFLLAVGSEPGSLLSRSRVIAGRIEVLQPAGAEWAAYPRIAYPLCGPGWLACGTAALAFDPLCGDGTGHAVREGILAAAVIRAAARGAAVEDLLAHYQARLLAGFLRHLHLCLEFYRTGGSGPWWVSEADLLRKGIEWCTAAPGKPEFRYRLEGFELLAIR